MSYFFYTNRIDYVGFILFHLVKKKITYFLEYFILILAYLFGRKFDQRLYEK